MRSPTYIYTAQEFGTLIQWGETRESKFLEFKKAVKDPAALTDKKASTEAQKKVCRDIAQFANTDGGCLLYGVSEERFPGSELATASEVSPAVDVDRSRQWILDAVKNFLVPSTLSLEIAEIRLSEGIVLAVNIKPSVDLVAVWDREQHTIQYLYRTSHGKAYMNPDEAERHQMNTSRSRRLAFIAAIDGETGGKANVMGGVLLRTFATGQLHEERMNIRDSVSWKDARDHTFELRVSDGGPGGLPTLAIPYGMVQEVWFADGKLNLVLSARLVKEDRSLTLDPFPTR